MYICLMLNLFNSKDISKRFPTHREGLKKKRKNKNPELFILRLPGPVLYRTVILVQILINAHPIAKSFGILVPASDIGTLDRNQEKLGR